MATTKKSKTKSNKTNKALKKTENELKSQATKAKSTADSAKKKYKNDSKKANDYWQKGFTYDDTNGFNASYLAEQSLYDDMVNNAGNYGFNAHINDVNDLFDQVMNYGDFSYDMNKDKLFQMYKTQYDQQGRQAMANTMGVATANSGGYNSSAAQTASQNTYQAYMNDLSEKAVDLYKNAYGQWGNNYDQLLNKYNTTRDMNNASNDAYYAQLNLQGGKRDTAYGLYQDDRTNQYNQFADYGNTLSNIAGNSLSSYQTAQTAYQNANQDLNNFKIKKLSYTGG